MTTPEIETPREFSAARIALRQKLRLRMLGVVAASYALDAVILLLYARAGATTLRVPLLYAFAGGLICAAFFVAFRNGVGERADDPFLTIWQSLLAVAVQVAFLTIAPEVGFVFLTVLFIVVGFSALRLTFAKAAILWGVTALGVAVVLSSTWGQFAIPVRTAAERWITGLFFVLTLGRCVTTGVLGSTYRVQLSERTAALRRLTATLEDEVARRTRDLARANEELERLVAERTAEIKSLQRVLPICSHCKKIRDDRGAWNQLEAYISAHTDVLFSHGICAECLKQHYPRLQRET